MKREEPSFDKYVLHHIFILTQYKIISFFFPGQNRTVECRVTGARPTPVIKWFKNEREIRGSTITVCFLLK